MPAAETHRRVRVEHAGEPVWGRVEGAEIALENGERIAEQSAQYLAPATPSKIIAVHLTYRSRVDEYAAQVPPAPLATLEDPDVLGAGDVISWPHPLADGEQVRVEHWTTAAEHGQLAGRNALLPAAERTAHELPPYFWSDQYDVKIQAVGFPARAERLEILESEGERFVAAGARDGRLVGVVAFNAAKRLGWYRRQLPELPSFEHIKSLVAADEKALGAAVAA